MSTILSVKVPAPSKVVMVSDSEGFAVWGLSPYQVLALYHRHTGDLEPIINRAEGQAQVGDVSALVMTLAGEFPVILAEILTLGSGGDPADVTDATIVHPVTKELVTLPSFDAALLLMQHLPFPVQLDALTKIADLTFTSDMPPKALLASVVILARNTHAVVGAASGSRSISGTGD